MPKLLRFSAYLASTLLIAHCGSNAPGDDDDDMSGGSSGASTGGGAGRSASGGTGGKGGAGGSAGAKGGTGGSTGGIGGSTGGTGGSTGGTGGSTGGTGGSTGGTGGSTGGAAGAPGGTGGTGGTGGGNPGGMGGTNSPGGMGGAGTAGTGPIVDQNGTPLAKPGDQKTGSREYLNLGDMRLLNNKWGSDELACNTTMRVFVASDRTLGWDFNRPTCGGAAAKPDYPEIEFGVHPFGAGNALATSPDFSSTLVLPKQIKDITTASVTLDSLAIALQNQQSWNTDFEFWLSERNPLTDPNPGVYAELIIFWGWQNGRWPCVPPNGNVTAGDRSYHLCHQDDNWANGQWRYFQFWDNAGPNQGFSGRVNVKALLDWLVNNYGYSRDLWVTRFEVGTEIDDNTSGTATIRNITFEVNGTSKSPQFGQ